MTTDPIANFLTKIRNAVQGRKDLVMDSYSNLKNSIAEIMMRHKFVSDAKVDEEDGKKVLVLHLNPERHDLNVKRVSKPGQRIYVGWKDMHRVRNGLGVGIYSTSQGVLTDREARKLKIGGEYICEIY